MTEQNAHQEIRVAIIEDDPSVLNGYATVYPGTRILKSPVSHAMLPTD